MSVYVCCKKNIRFNNVNCPVYLLEKDNDQCLSWPHMNDSMDWGELQQECEHDDGHVYLIYISSSAMNIDDKKEYMWATLHEIINLRKVDDCCVSEETVSFVLQNIDIFANNDENVSVGYLNVAEEMKSYYKNIGIPYKRGASYIELTTAYDPHYLKCLVLLGKHICLEKNEDIYTYLEDNDCVLKENNMYFGSERNIWIV